MKISKIKLTAIIFLIIGIVAGVLVAANLRILPLSFAKDTTESAVVDKYSSIFENFERAFIKVAEQVGPAVVNISTTKTVKGGNFYQFEFPDREFKRFFGDDFFDWFFNDKNTPSYKQKNLGSGIIITQDGYILTNNHVVEGVDEIRIKLLNGKEYKGKFINSDPDYDVAVIKIEQNNLPTAKIGDSDKLKIGQWVIAIGNPFGLDHTVTAGIISAKERSIGMGSKFNDFIQTDASINPGNSGGPLVDLSGEVIGINTAIQTTSGGNIGIGFAIPINAAMLVFRGIKEHGRVVKGYLGIYLEDLDPEKIEYFGLSSGNGVLVTEVIKGSPAEKYGIKRGDIIIEYDGKRIGGVGDLQTKVATTVPGKKVEIKLIRNKKEKIVEVVIGERPKELTSKQEEEKSSSSGQLGLTVENYSEEEEGVIVTEVESDSPAEKAGIRRGDIIIEINESNVRDVGDFYKLIEKGKNKKTILFVVRREGHLKYIVVRKD